MNNFKEKYSQLKSDIFYMVYYDINDFVVEHKDKEFDWSELSFKTFDVPSKKPYKFGPQVNWGIAEVDKYYNKNRVKVETLEFILDDSEDGFDFWEGIVVNGIKIMGICEDEKVEIVDYMEKQLNNENT